MDRLIPTFNLLQDIAANLNLPGGIELPQIVVVGAQSSGKSSVLESLVGKDFLPRGTGIVTRRPLVLRLCHLVEDQQPWGVFHHMPSQYFMKFEDIRTEIENATNQVAAGDKIISPDPIYLCIYSHQVLNITLVDLPGITKVPVGDQPRDIEQLVRSIIMTYIQKPNAIILAISAANTDLANSDALKLAREVDPLGERTVGVLTKLDLMDRGTNALDVLNNKVYPLKLGYIGMVCRSQLNIQQQVTIETHLETERKYFTEHEQYALMADRLGSPYLAKRLNQLLNNHLRVKLPELKKKVAEMLVTYEEEMRRYGPYFDDSPEGKSSLLLNALERYQKEFQNRIEGKFIVQSPSELQGGAYINYIFFTLFRKSITDISALEGLNDAEIRGVIHNSEGLRPSFFISNSAFELLIKRQIIRFQEPALSCASLVLNTLKSIAFEQIELADFTRFPVLKTEVLKVVESVLTGCHEASQRKINELIDMEMAFINIQHPDFIGCSEAVALVQSQLAPPHASAARPQARVQGFEDVSSNMAQSPQIFGAMRPEIEMGVIKKLLDSYFKIVCKNVGDMVPKAIVHFLVNESEKTLHRELLVRLFQPSLFDELLVEAEGVAEHRKKCSEYMISLNQMNEVLTKVNFIE